MTQEKPLVSGLLSVYHGQEYLPSLLRSLADQHSATLRLHYLLDDGDAAQGETIESLMPGAERMDEPPGLGVPTAFMRLLDRVPQEADYYCFVDQDDIWLPTKLERAVQVLSRTGDEPTLWVSRVRPFQDRQGRRSLGRAYPAGVPRPSWRNALVECIGPGCAMVWNRALHQAVSDRPPPEGIMMHDWWLYAVASTVGRVVVDPDPLVLYRLHGANAVGIDRSVASRVRRWRSGRLPGQASIESQAQSLLDAFGDQMSPEQRTVTAEIAAHDRLRMLARALKGDVYRTSRADYAVLCARMLLS